MTGAELLGSVRARFPGARRGLLIEFGGWRDEATAAAILAAPTDIAHLLEENAGQGDDIVGYAEALARSKEHNRKMKKRRNRAETENARLLEALKAIEEVAAGFVKGKTRTGSDFELLYSIASTAIAKAEGSQS